MSNEITSVLTPIRDFLLPFFILAAVVYVLKLIIRKFDFFRASSKVFGQQIEMEAGSHIKPKGRERQKEPPEVIDQGELLREIPTQIKQIR